MKAVATVEPNGENVVKPWPGEPSGADAAPQSRFAYASGSQPLSGYTIKRGIGHGGFGEVYYAMSDAGKEVALKLIRRNLDVELRGVKQCLNLKHPNLVAIYDLRQDPHGENWVIMEYVTGDCLEEVVAAHPHGLPVDQALAWFHGIAAGVASLHDHGIVHRDLKPGNIFSDEGLVKLGDYGLTKFISCSRRSGHTESVGTVHYMAPEIANGRYGKEIDIYALGVILYEMLTGRVPFEGESVGEVLMKHLTTVPDVSMLHEPFRSVVARALEKEPAKRFASVGQFLAALPRPVRPEVHAGPLPSGNSSRATARTMPGAEAAEVPAAELVPEEPILAAVRKAGRELSHAWNGSPLNTPAKVLIALAGLWILLPIAAPLLMLAAVLCVLYAMYWMVRAIVLLIVAPPRARVSPTPASPLPGASPGARGGSPFRPGVAPVVAAPSPVRRRELALDALVLKPPRERAAELLGSLLGSALVAAVMALVMLIVNSYRGAGPRLEQAAWIALATQGTWLTLVSIAGAWAVLIPAKFWEGLRGDGTVRRFVLMVLGLALGAGAWAASWLLQFNLTHDRQLSGAQFRDIPGCYDTSGQPLIMAFMAAFAALFFVLRWWRQADPLRTTRLSLPAMIGSVFVAWLIAATLGFPPAWLMMTAGAMSVSVQLASPWMHPRSRLREYGR